MIPAKRRGRPPKPKPVYAKNSEAVKIATEVIEAKKHHEVTEASLNNLRQATEAADELRALPITDKQAIILKALQSAGYNKSQSAAIMDLSNARISAVAERANNGALDDLRQNAARVIKDLLGGKLVGKMDRISGSEILAAAKEVLSRTDPAIHKVEQKSTIHQTGMSAAERMQYLKALGITDKSLPPPTLVALPNPAVSDAKFEIIEEKKEDAKQSTA